MEVSLGHSLAVSWTHRPLAHPPSLTGSVYGVTRSFIVEIRPSLIVKLKGSSLLIMMPG